jgi:hypothetical protein
VLHSVHHSHGPSSHSPPPNKNKIWFMIHNLQFVHALVCFIIHSVIRLLVFASRVWSWNPQATIQDGEQEILKSSALMSSHNRYV